ncbi:right-handed parallel beta-helix repeat-containing protein [Pseudonocardia xinjiangensis]|uniref:right-handed parallel beta-helix repeat-containing protein n=1 Tax=Pseudonocardia xinjiangensis TaxID=75289 RepID=UPI003D8DBD84
MRRTCTRLLLLAAALTTATVMLPAPPAAAGTGISAALAFPAQSSPAPEQPEPEPEPEPRREPAPLRQPPTQAQPQPQPQQQRLPRAVPQPQPTRQSPPAPAPASEPEPQPQPQPAPRVVAVPPPAPAPPAAAPRRNVAGERPAARPVRPVQRSAPQDAARQARDRAAERSRQQAAAARAAGRNAAASDKIRLAWEERGRPSRMAIVRTARVDVVADGRLTQQVPLRPGLVTLPLLDRSLPPTWLRQTADTALLDATVILTPGTTMDIAGDASGIRTLALAGGPSTTDTASLYTGGGRLSLRGLTITSADPATGQPLPPSPGRPSIVVTGHGRLDATDTTITDLGTPDLDTTNGHAAVAFNPASTGALVRTTLARNSTGLELSRSDAVHLDQLTVSDSTSDGIVLRGDRGTTMNDIRAERNAGNGMIVTGESTDRPITGVSTAHNGVFGLAIIGQTGIQVIGVATASDRSGGLRLSRSKEVVVTGFSATDQSIGVFTHVNSANLTLDHMTVTRGRRGLVVEKSTQGLALRDSTFQGARVAGVSVGGQDVTVTGVQVSDSATGVRIERGARTVTVTGLRLRGGHDGIVATPDTTGVLVQDLVAEGVAFDTVRTFSPDTRIIGGHITGGTTGIDVGAATTISGTVIDHAQEGIRSRSAQLVHADNVDVATTALGINAAEGSPFLLTASRVHALEAVRGQVGQAGPNELSLPPLNLLGAVGIPLILLAIVLEQVHTRRQRRTAHAYRRPPPVLPSAGG